MDPPLPPIRSSYQAYRDSYHDTYPVHGDTDDIYPVRCGTYPLSGNTYHNMFYNSFQERDVSSSVTYALLFLITYFWIVVRRFPNCVLQTQSTAHRPWLMFPSLCIELF
jgi:hypothetical protein